jgi:putative tryptophan/tyrosine transport system substrate-binding protein
VRRRQSETHEAPTTAELPSSPSQRAEAVYVCGDALAVTHRVRINETALAVGLPRSTHRATSCRPAAYCPTDQIFRLFRRSADYADKILRGAKPADLPLEQPTKFDLIVNLKTAKTLGRLIPETFRALADEVIE